MKKGLAAFIVAFIAMVTQAQKTINDPNVEVRNVKNFQGISVSSGIDLYLSYGDETVAVSASTVEFRNEIKTEVVDGILKIWIDGNSWKNIFKGGIRNVNRKLKAYVSYKTLNTLKASGGCDVFVDGSIKTNSLKLNLSGGCDFKGKVEVAADFEVHQSGGCDVKISGTASNVTIHASGGSDFKGFDLTTDACTITASGGCDVEITANKEVTATASGASDIHYKGSAVVKDVRTSGASSIRHRS